MLLVASAVLGCSGRRGGTQFLLSICSWVRRHRVRCGICFRVRTPSRPPPSGYTWRSESWAQYDDGAPGVQGDVEGEPEAVSRASLSAIRGTRSSACNSIQTTLGLLLNFLHLSKLLLALYRLGSFLIVVCNHPSCNVALDSVCNFMSGARS